MQFEPIGMKMCFVIPETGENTVGGSNYVIVAMIVMALLMKSKFDDD